MLILINMMKGYFRELPECDGSVSVAIEEYEIFAHDCIPQNIGRETVLDYVDEEMVQARPIRDSGLAFYISSVVQEGLKPVAGFYFMARGVIYGLLSLGLLVVGMMYFVANDKKMRHKMMYVAYLLVIIFSVFVGVFAKLWLPSLVTNSLTKPIAVSAINAFVGELLVLNLVLVVVAWVHRKMSKSKQMGYSIYLDRIYKIIVAFGVLGLLLNFRVLSFLRLGVES